MKVEKVITKPKPELLIYNKVPRYRIATILNILDKETNDTVKTQVIKPNNDSKFWRLLITIETQSAKTNEETIRHIKDKIHEVYSDLIADRR